MARDSFIYFIRCKDRIKIGWSFDPSRRLRILQQGNPEPMHILATIPGGQVEERRLHWRLREARLDEKSEWFDGDSVMAYLIGADLLSDESSSKEVR